MAVKIGTITVDFAGARDEARDFANQYKGILHLAHKEGPRPDCLPMLIARYTSKVKRVEILKLLDSLGWDEHSFVEKVKVYKNK